MSFYHHGVPQILLLLLGESHFHNNHCEHLKANDRFAFLALIKIAIILCKRRVKKRPNFCYKDFIAHFTAF